MKPFSRKVNLTISLRYIQSLSFEKGKKKKKVLDPFPSHWCLHYHAWIAAYFLTKTHFVKKMHACPTKKNMKENKIDQERNKKSKSKIKVHYFVKKSVSQTTRTKTNKKFLRSTRKVKNSNWKAKLIKIRPAKYLGTENCAFWLLYLSQILKQ